MLNNIVKQASNWDTKALSKIFNEKKFSRSSDGDKKKYRNYLLDLVSENSNRGYHERDVVTLPKEIIPDNVTLDTFTFAYKKDPSILPILLKYFTHKSLLKEAKDDLDKINQKLQGVMNEQLKKLQDEQRLLQEEIAKLIDKEMDAEQAKVFAINSKKITETSSDIEKIKLYQKDIKNLLNGEKVTIRAYPQEYYSILNDELTKMMEEKLKAYAEDNKADVEKTYQSLNSRAEKITRIRNMKNVLLPSAYMAIIIPGTLVMGLGMFCMGVQHGPQPSFLFPMVDITIFYILPIMLSISVALFAAAGVAHLVNRSCEQSFAKEVENLVEEQRHMDEVTIKSQEQKNLLM
ncbi:MAG: hypothetical protein ACR5K9_06655 [Wolbachia sp.]